jgi:hypothetical protein
MRRACDLTGLHALTKREASGGSARNRRLALRGGVPLEASCAMTVSRSAGVRLPCWLRSSVAWLSPDIREAAVFRAMGVAVALALTPAGASATAGSYQELPASWAASYLPLPAGWEFIEVGDWTLVDPGDDSLTFVMAARQPTHIWTRTEHRRPSTTGTRSYRHLQQVDCNGWRVRVITSQWFSASNLQTLRLSDDEAQPWSYPAPGTVGEIPLIVLCD